MKYKKKNNITYLRQGIIEDEIMENKEIFNYARILVDENLTNPSVNGFMCEIYNYDKKTYYHSINTAYLIAQMCLLSKIKSGIVNEYIKGALLHDVGNLFISKAILEKRGYLTALEYNEIKTHPQKGRDYIDNKNRSLLSDIVSNMILYHHEFFDGSGYPFGIKMIPNEAAMLIVADAYEGMTKNKSYGDIKTSATSIQNLKMMNYPSSYIKLIEKCEVK